MNLSRRQFSGLLVSSFALCSMPSLVRAAVGDAPTRSLSFHNLHTGEDGHFTYMKGGLPDGEGLKQIQHILRDHRTGEIEAIDPALLDQLYTLRQSVGAEKKFNIISGYRSPKTNAMLRGKSNGGVAKKSYHMRGMAIDISMDDVNIRELHKNAKAMQAGGVGLYTGSGFIHVDSGPVRAW